LLLFYHADSENSPEDIVKPYPVGDTDDTDMMKSVSGEALYTIFGIIGPCFISGNFILLLGASLSGLIPRRSALNLTHKILPFVLNFPKQPETLGGEYGAGDTFRYGKKISRAGFSFVAA
jgi:hypothetical protein